MDGARRGGMMSTVTVSTTAGLLAALKTAQAGETIDLQAGTYSGVNIQGVNFTGAVTITSADPNNPAVLAGLTVTNSSGLTFSGLDLSTQGVTGAVAFGVGNSQNLTFTNLDVAGTTATWNTVEGFVVRWSSNITISNSSFSYLWNGIQELSNSGVNISNNSFSNLTGDGIDNGGSQNVTIADNTFTDFQPNGTEHPDAIQFWTTNMTVPNSNILIEGNTITRGSGGLIQGIYLSDQVGTLPYTNLTISGNTVAGAIYNAITVGDGISAVISGNTVIEYAGQQSWIWINKSTGTILENNSTPSFNLTSDTGTTLSGNVYTTYVPIPTGGGTPSAPVITAPTTVTIGVDQQTVIGGVSLSENGATSGETFTVTLNDTNGNLFETAGQGAITGNGTPNMTIVGTLAQVNADLASLSDPPLAGSTTAAINLSAKDSLGGAAVPAAINVIVNGAPVLTAPASATTMQNSATALAGLSLSETGNTAGETFTVKLTDTYGVLSATGTGISGSGSTSLTLTGSLAQVNSALASLTDTDASTAADTISITASDSLGDATPVVGVAVSVTPVVVNGAPVLTAPATAAVKQNAATAISGLGLSETGNTAGEIFTVKLSDANGQLSATGTGVSGSGSTSLTLTGSLAQVNSALASLTDTDASTTADTIKITASDSLGGSAVAVSTGVSVSPVVVNGAPVLTAPATAAVKQNAATGVSGLGLSETGDTTGEIFTVKLTDTSGALSAIGTGVSGSGSTSLTLTGSLAQVNSALASLTDTDASTAADTIKATASDSLGGSAAAVGIAVSVTPVVVNGAPVLTVPAAATVNQSSATAISGLGLSETGNTAGEIFTVKLSDANGQLSATGTGVSGSGSTSLTLTGSLAQVNSALASLTDTDASTTADTIKITASDSLGGSAAAVGLAVSVTPTPTDHAGGHGPGWWKHHFAEAMAALATTTSAATTTGGSTLSTSTTSSLLSPLKLTSNR